MSAMPSGRLTVTAEPVMWTLLSISRTIPAKLSATPPIFFQVSGSLSTTAATNMVNIGVVAVTMEVSTGVVMPMAMRKVICGR